MHEAPSASLLAACAALALLGFWALGARNRLVKLRNRIAAAWAQVHDSGLQRGQALVPLVAALRLPFGAEQGALDSVLTAHTQAQQTAMRMTAAPVSAASAQAWVAGEAALAAAASRMLALLDQQAALRTEEPVASLLAALNAAQARLPFARQLFNQAAAPYNQALLLFPTRLLVPMFRYAPAGVL